MNQQITDTFQKLIVNTINKKEPNNKFKIISYKKTITIINNLDFEITSSSQLKDIKGIGKSTIDKINEILETGTLQILANIDTESQSLNKELYELQKITGIGAVKAKKLLDNNITLSNLININFKKPTKKDKELLSNLTHHQILGVKYFNDLEHKIPYKEISSIEKYLKNLLRNYNDKLNMVICGSYRREKPSSGDIDILIYHEELTTEKELKKLNFLTEFIELLISNNFITDNLTSPDNPTKYMGFCKFSELNRRIDIRLIPKTSLGSAMLYFTGSGEFNKAMRTYALTKNYTINEYGIYKLDDSKNKKFKIITQSEKDIFNVLKLKYVAPKDRLPSYKFV